MDAKNGIRPVDPGEILREAGEAGAMTEKTKEGDGMDVQKDSAVIAAPREGERGPALVKRLSHEPGRLRRVQSRMVRYL